MLHKALLAFTVLFCVGFSATAEDSQGQLRLQSLALSSSEAGTCRELEVPGLVEPAVEQTHIGTSCPLVCVEIAFDCNTSSDCTQQCTCSCTADLDLCISSCNDNAFCELACEQFAGACVDCCFVET